MKQFSVVFGLIIISLLSSVVIAQEGDYYSPESVQPVTSNQTTVNRDNSVQAGYFRDAILADAVDQLSGSVKYLANRIEGKAPSREIDKAVVDVNRQAEKSSASLTAQQRAHVRRIADRAINAAANKDIESLKNIQAEMTDIVSRLTKAEETIESHESRILQLEAANRSSGGNEAVDVLINSGVAEAKAKAEEAVNTANEAKIIAEANVSDDSETAEIKNQLDKNQAETARALARAEAAYQLAQGKMDAGLVEVGVRGLFTPKVTTALVTGTYWIRKNQLRVGLGGAIGYGLARTMDGFHGFGLDTKVKIGYQIKPWFSPGLFLNMYGAGRGFDRQMAFGYGAGGYIRFQAPNLGKKNNVNIGLEVNVGPAMEYCWVSAEPPAGILPGATYKTERLTNAWAPQGGLDIYLNF